MTFADNKQAFIAALPARQRHVVFEDSTIIHAALEHATFTRPVPAGDASRLAGALHAVQLLTHGIALANEALHHKHDPSSGVELSPEEIDRYRESLLAARRQHAEPLELEGVHFETETAIHAQAKRAAQERGDACRLFQGWLVWLERLGESGAVLDVLV